MDYSFVGSKSEDLGEFAEVVNRYADRLAVAEGVRCNVHAYHEVSEERGRVFETLEIDGSVLTLEDVGDSYELFHVTGDVFAEMVDFIPKRFLKNTVCDSLLELEYYIKDKLEGRLS